MSVIDRLVHLQIQDPKILIGPKGSFGVIDPEGEHTINCIGCEKELRFRATLLNCTLLHAACSKECASHFVWPELPKAEPPKPKPVEPDLPDDDEDDLDLPEDEQPKLKVVQPPKEKRGPCPKCGGEPSRGRGYKHNEVDGKPCPESTEAKLAAKKAEREAAKANAPPKPPKEPKAPVETCPQCGGGKRGRGYSHQEVNGQPCPATIKVAEPHAPREHKEKKPPRPLGNRGKRVPKGMLDD